MSEPKVTTLKGVTRVSFVPEFEVGDTIRSRTKDGSDAGQAYVIESFVLGYVVEGGMSFTTPSPDSPWELIKVDPDACEHRTMDGKMSYTDPVCQRMGYLFCPLCGGELVFPKEAS